MHLARRASALGRPAEAVEPLRHLGRNGKQRWRCRNCCWATLSAASGGWRRQNGLPASRAVAATAGRRPRQTRLTCYVPRTRITRRSLPSSGRPISRPTQLPLTGSTSPSGFAHQGDYGNAIPCWQQALALQPEQVSLHLGLSLRAATTRGGFAEAEAARSATPCALQPDSAAAPLYGLGSLYEATRRTKTQAEVAFRAALQLHPAFTLAWERLVQAVARATIRRGSVRSSRDALADPHLPATERVKLLFASAAIADAGGDYHRAADCARTANALKLDRSPAVGVWPTIRNVTHRFVDGAIQGFRRRLLPAPDGMGLEAAAAGVCLRAAAARGLRWWSRFLPATAAFSVRANCVWPGKAAGRGAATPRSGRRPVGRCCARFSSQPAIRRSFGRAIFSPLY